MKTLRLILGDQLSHGLSSLKDCDQTQDVVLMCEVWEEATYVKHHKKKIAFLFSAMRHFAEELCHQGYRVDYVTLDAADNSGSFSGEVSRAIARHKPNQIVVTFPGEYRVLQMMQLWQTAFGLPVEIRADNRFLCSFESFAAWAKGRRQLRMEYFYRDLRKQYGILMHNQKPAGGQWNYDTENRKLPPAGLTIPKPFYNTPDAITQAVCALVQERFADHFGDLEPFYFAVTRDQARQALALFIKQRLPYFGDYQDAMVQGEPWLYHSQISFYLNCGLLAPLECVQAAEAAYQAGAVPLNAAEGFIRQIIGWREFVRGVYWLKMPSYTDENFLDATHPLPDFFWSGDTPMNCLRQCITETKKNAYAHHIQRLMVLGNFALLVGIDPKAVNEWYLLVYADAFEWVELPNVSGMVLFADGGLLASKPYAASGSYIKKMSNYCSGCYYDVATKTGENACPFNYLYWNFLMRNWDKLGRNPRLSMVYKTLERMDMEKRQAISQDSQKFYSQRLVHS